MEKKTVVLYPGVGIGHLAPMLELAKAFLRHGGGAFDVAVALVEPPVRDPGFSAAVARAKASNTSVAFHVLPPPPPTDGDGEQGHRMARMLRFLRAMNAPLRDFLRSLPSLSVGSSVQALVLDMFLRRKARRRRRAWPARLLLLRLGRDRPRRLPRTARRAGQHGHRLHGARRRRPGERASMDTSFMELGDAVLSFPGAPPFKASELPSLVADDGEASKAILRMVARMPDARGVLINTFESLEPRAVRALRDGLCVPGRPHAAGQLRRAARVGRRRRQGARVPPVAGRAVGPQRRVPLLREHGHVPQEPAQGDRHW
uniref:Uncharacterized protein n=1 Tax=Arundo donax TaxID=35708 RepID=A0A0A9DD23_ARUDO